jgi:hypothetical protein
MPIKGQIGTFSRTDERAQAPGHDPVVLSGALKADDGEYPVGLLLTRAADGKLNPLAVVADEVIATGDGATQVYTATLAGGLPLEPGTLSIGDGVETFSDDGHGRLVGSAGGSGTVYYATGVVTVDFVANVANAVNVTADYTTRIDGVLDDLVDTAEAAAGNYVAHGTVRRDVLKVGRVAQAAPAAGLLMLMQGQGLYPVG